MTFDPDSFLKIVTTVSRTEPDTYRRLGFADFRLLLEMVGPEAAGTQQKRTFGLVLDGYDITYEGEIDPRVFGADAVLSGPIEVWTEMADNIAANVGADRVHTLNALTIAGEPLTVRSDDPLGRDRFFRYIETLQHIVDGWGRRVPAGL